MKKFNLQDYKRKKNLKQKITMLTAYDYYSALIIAEAQIDNILVGDSLGMVIQGKDNTLSVSLSDIIYHTQAVRKGAPNSFIIADMPFMSYHLNPIQSVENAGALITRAGADAVKCEINSLEQIKHIKAIINAQIPVIAHIGMTPQSINLFGGFKVQGRTKEQVDHIKHLAFAAEKVQVSAMVIECVPHQLALELTNNLEIATIGIGAGNSCDGQVLVFNDLVGINATPPKFVKKYLEGRELIKTAITTFKQDVENQNFPNLEHFY